MDKESRINVSLLKVCRCYVLKIVKISLCCRNYSWPAKVGSFFWDTVYMAWDIRRERQENILPLLQHGCGGIETKKLTYAIVSAVLYTAHCGLMKAFKVSICSVCLNLLPMLNCVQKKHPLLFSCITLRSINRFKWKPQTI